MTTPSSTSTSAPTTTSTTLVPPTTSNPFVVGRLADSWEGHGRVLAVKADGSFDLSYRLYNSCDSDPAPCDSFQKDTIIPGGSVTGRFDAGASPRWTGHITKAADSASWPIGVISADYDAATGILSLQPGTVPRDDSMTLCGPTAAPGACGA